MKVMVKDGQTLADTVLQEYGTLEALGKVAEANRISMSDIPEAGCYLECPDIDVDKYLKRYAKDKQISPATANDYGTHNTGN